MSGKAIISVRVNAPKNSYCKAKKQTMPVRVNSQRGIIIKDAKKSTHIYGKRYTNP